MAVVLPHLYFPRLQVDMRDPHGIVQDTSKLSYIGGKDYASRTNFTCMATSGDGYVAVGAQVCPHHECLKPKALGTCPKLAWGCLQWWNGASKVGSGTISTVWLA